MKNKKMCVVRVKRMNLPYLYIAVMLAIFNAGASLLKYIFPSVAIQCVVVASIIAVEAMLFLRLRMFQMSKVKFGGLMLLAVMEFFLIYNSAYATRETLLFTACLFLCFLAMQDQNAIKYSEYAFRVIYVMMVVYAAATIICYLSPALYKNVIINLFSEYKDSLLKSYNEGSMAGLTTHFSTNGMFMATGLIMSCTKFLMTHKKKDLVCVVYFLVALLLTGKRAHTIFSALSVYLLYYLSQSNQNKVSRFIKMLGIVLVCLGLFTVLLSVVPALANFILRFQKFADGGDVSNGRFLLWGVAIESFKQHPLLGIGWKQFIATLFAHYSAGKMKLDVHNVYLQLLCETGIIGFSAYVTWFVVVFRNTIKLYKASLSASCAEHKMYTLSFSLSYQTFFLLYCLTGNPLYDLPCNILYFLCCSVTLSLMLHKRTKRTDECKNMRRKL